jgi:glycerophosphoryl diester phosphodiesterase
VQPGPLPAVDRELLGRSLRTDLRRLNKLTSAEISRLCLPGGSAIPRLADAMDAFPDLRWNIDIKDWAGVAAVSRLVAAGNHVDRVCLTSFRDARIAAVREMLGTSLCTGVGGMGWLRVNLAAFLRLPLPAHFLSEAAVLQVPSEWRGINLVTPRVIEIAHDLNLALHVWTLNTPDQIRAAIDMRVDGIITDNPALLKTELLRRNLWPN